MELFPTRLGRLARPTVTRENRHQKKYEVNNPKVSIILLTGYLQSSLPCLVNIANHTDQNRIKVLYILRKTI